MAAGAATRLAPCSAAAFRPTKPPPAGGFSFPGCRPLRQDDADAAFMSAAVAGPAARKIARKRVILEFIGEYVEKTMFLPAYLLGFKKYTWEYIFAALGAAGQNFSSGRR